MSCIAFVQPAFDALPQEHDGGATSDHVGAGIADRGDAHVERDPDVREEREVEMARRWSSLARAPRPIGRRGRAATRHCHQRRRRRRAGRARCRLGGTRWTGPPH